MPRTIDEGFRDFLGWLTPTCGESIAASGHRSTVQACLANSYALKRFLRIGSFGNGTSICGYSDVDYLAEVSNDDLSANSFNSLRTLRGILDDRFPRTNVGVRCPAVEVPFGTDARDHTEVVLGFDTGKRVSGHIVYGIPDCTGGWMATAPDAHKAYVVAQDDRLGRKVRPLIRFLKAWKFFRNVPISSFYLEMRVAEYASSEKSIEYGYDVARVLKWLQDLGLARLQDPAGVSGYIRAAKTDQQLNNAYSKLETAATRAANARGRENMGDISGAFDWWRLLYDDQFPRYYR